MFAKKLIAAVTVFAAAGSVFAAEVTEGVYPTVESTKTRAQVIAELEQAKADGSYALMHQEFPGQDPIAATQYARAQAEKSKLARNGNAAEASKSN
jgi:hypothetical protein